MALGLIEEFSFNDGQEVANLCVGNLRRVRSLADIVPPGRLFSAISTLNDAAIEAEQALSEHRLHKAAHVLSQALELSPPSAAQGPYTIDTARRTG